MRVIFENSTHFTRGDQQPQPPQVVLEGGDTLEASPGHPMARGGTLSGLHAGDVVGGRMVLEAELIDYADDHTYDILPDSAGGTYWANGIELRSTLLQR